MSGYDEQSWCECGHEMELVRPGKHQKVGCCERIAELENQLASGVHTCSNQCQRPMCVLRRENRELEAKVESLTEWNQNAQSLNGLLELRAERLEKDLSDSEERCKAREKVLEQEQAKVEHVKHLIKLYRYDHGLFPYDTLMIVLEGE